MTIAVEDLVFDYPTTRALSGVSFVAENGSVTALVGPNGAGKSTLMRCIAGLDSPVAGRVLLDNFDVHQDPRKCHERMGFLSDFFGLYDNLTVSQCLRHRAMTQGLPRAEHEARVMLAAERVGLSDRLTAKAGELSRGLRQRLAIGQAILHDPELILLDEPASGLDPDARLDLSKMLRELRDQGMTLIVSSHILAELEEYSTHMLLLNDGKVLQHGPIDQTGDDVDGELTLVVELARPVAEWQRLFEGLEPYRLLEYTAQSARVVAPKAPEAHHALLLKLIQAELPVATFSPERPDLQAAYLKRMREEEAS